MKSLKIIGLNILLLLTISVIAQKEANVWYFGDGAGLDFNSSPPVALTDGFMYTLEGCASIADAQGSLLFYTDGSTVWNKSHMVMSNGLGLLGDNSSTQSAVIVPKPNSSTIYYIFTVDNDAGSDGLNYSEVDISLNAGLGDINTNKNIQLITPSLEKITAVLHKNGTDIWVIAHEWNSDAFYAYLVTSTGVNTVPVISNSGTYIGTSLNCFNEGGLCALGCVSIGYLKSSPDGKHLALAHWSYNEAQLFEFDNSNGVVSTPITISINYQDEGPYGLAFSPSGNLLFIAESIWVNGGGGRILQYDLTATNIPLSETTIGTLPQGTAIGALQLGPNGKIYVATMNINGTGSSFLSVIDKPNIKGLNCDFMLNGVSLNSRYCQGGLPSFIQSYFNTPYDPNQNSSNIVYLPTAFSPNGDGRNDELYVRGKNIDKIELIIYNRFGELVFKTNDPSAGWDGTHRGKKLNTGVFIANLNVTFLDSETKQLYGNITLVR